MMKVNNNEIKLAILDLDGTLLDSTSMWHQIDIEFFAKRGMECPPHYFDEIAHLGLIATAKYTKEKYGIKESPEEMIKEWHDASIYQYQKVIQLKPYAKEFLDYLKANNVHLSLATANSEEYYVPCLKRLGILDYFELIKDVNSVKAGKQSPLLYDSISTFFNIKKENTVVVEDIVTGLKTAFENGYNTIGVSDKASENTVAEKRKYSHVYVDSFIEIIK